MLFKLQNVLTCPLYVLCGNFIPMKLNYSLQPREKGVGVLLSKIFLVLFPQHLDQSDYGQPNGLSDKDASISNRNASGVRLALCFI